MQLTEHIRNSSMVLTPDGTDATPNLRPLTGIRAVLFDIYGTLLISGSGDVGTINNGQSDEAFKRACNDAGISISQPQRCLIAVRLLEEEIRRTHGDKKSQGIKNPEVEIRKVWQAVTSSLMEEGVLGTQEIHEQQIEMLSVSYECITNPTWPMPCAATLIDSLRRRGQKLGIVSNAQFYTPLMLEAHFHSTPEKLGFSPSLTVWSFQLGMSKPAMEMFERILQTLKNDFGILPEETVYIGNDMLNDVYTAKKCGLKTILFAGDRRSLRMREEIPECISIAPDRTVTDLCEVLEHLIL